MMANQPIRSIIMAAAPVPVRDVTGLPAWANSEPYDVVAKPPAGATVEQRRDMFRRMFEERMQLKAHVEEREQNAFALVLDRADGRLGPQLSISTSAFTSASFICRWNSSSPSSRCSTRRRVRPSTRSSR